MTFHRFTCALAAMAMLGLGAVTTARADIVNGMLPDLSPNDSLLGFDGVPAEKAKQTYKAVLNGGQAVPPTPSSATGVAYLAYYKRSNQLCWHISYTQLDGNEVDAHLHAGSVGEARVPFLINLPPFPSTVKTGCASFDVTSKRTRNAILKLLKNGQTYINVHSDLTVDLIEYGKTGEIRGQVIPIKGVR